ncbi:hypothetical protein HK405_002384 [Cladochytrium tenue]|nr:hypothetical protein HK405_002384 [Cladochytrium tenue]
MTANSEASGDAATATPPPAVLKRSSRSNGDQPPLKRQRSRADGAPSSFEDHLLNMQEASGRVFQQIDIDDYNGPTQMENDYGQTDVSILRLFGVTEVCFMSYM